MDNLFRYWRLLSRKWSHFFKIYDAEPEIAAGFRAQQIQSILRLTPLTMLANAFNILVILFLFIRTEIAIVISVWSLTLAVIIFLGAKAWLKQRNSLMPSKTSPRALKQAAIHALLLGSIWGLLPIVALDGNLGSKSVFLITVLTGMICAGGFALSSIPQAAFLYVCSLTGCFVIALTLTNFESYWPLIILLGLYAFIICSAVLASARTFGARLMAEAAAAQQQQVIGLLLHDFESHASDWLWELDNQGFLRRPSSRLVHLFGISQAQLHQTAFIELLAGSSSPEDRETPHQLLLEHLESHTPFSELTVPVNVKNQRFWWRLTAKPLFSAQGNFEGWRGVGSDITDKRQAELEMQRLANYDALTHLANRHNFSQQLERAREHQFERPFALFLLDLDNFKNVNDSLGHAVGDKVLQVAAKRLLTSTRSQDVIARLGGDEFALISFGDTNDLGATQLAQRLLAAFDVPFFVDGKNLLIGCSMGIALAPEQGQDADKILRSADIALYAAKSAGRHTFRFYESGMEKVAQDKLHLLNDMRAALEEHTATNKLLNKNFNPDIDWPSTPIAGQFEIHFQPQINLANHDIVGFESLIRWRHPEHGLIPPAHFIPIAEESNLIIPIGTWVLVESCKYAAKWQAPWRIAVNLSPVQFRDPNLVDMVRWALRISRLPAERLELEITESLLIQDNNSAQQKLTELRALGVRIALDDFGTGYSSLAYLRIFPLTKLKIDRSFITTLTADTHSLAIINAIIQLAGALKLETTAEGIESSVEAEILRSCGCGTAQGFYFSRPLPLAQTMEWAADYCHSENV